MTLLRIVLDVSLAVVVIGSPPAAAAAPAPPRDR